MRVVERADADVGDADVEAVLGAIAEPVRLRILQLLAREELCVCHLTDELDAGQSLVSHHLGVLRRAGLVESSRHSYWTYYRLRPEALRRLAGDLERLADSTPPGGTCRRPCC